MWRWADVKLRRCEDEKMSRCEDEKMWRCEDEKMRRCEDAKMRRWADVKMRRCQDVKMRSWEAEKLRRCEDEKMWRWDDVKMWRCEDVMRRCEDVRMRRWEDVKIWRCYVKMWGCENVKMFDRPPLLEEPFAQTLSGKVFPWTPCFLWPWQQFGDKTEHFCGICIVLEVEPLARKVFAGHWTWKSSIHKVCQHVVNIWGSTLPFQQHLQHLGVRIFHFRWLLLNLRWFKVCLWLV